MNADVTAAGAGPPVPAAWARAVWVDRDVDPVPEPHRPEVVTLCGSMRFWPLIPVVAAEETAAGRVVPAPFAVVAQAEAEQDSDLTATLDELHRRKIDLADRVVVVTDASGHHGRSTRGEIAYATEHGVPVQVREVRPARRVGRDVDPPWTAVDSGVWHAVERVDPPRDTGDPHGVAGSGGAR